MKLQSPLSRLNGALDRLLASLDTLDANISALRDAVEPMAASPTASRPPLGLTSTAASVEISEGAEQGERLRAKRAESSR